MTTAPISLTLSSPEATADLAARLGARLRPGDTLLLVGPIGAGKTHFCRSLIQSLLDEPEDVPSPTFTLVQTYEAGIGEIWHADLYRLSGPGEIVELGLAEAFETAVCLVEWPDRLGPDAPANALHVTLHPDPDAEDLRRITLAWTDPKWAEKLDRLTS